MAGAIDKLKRMKSRLKGGKDASIAVPYEITCDCGELVRGVRRDTWIESECSVCCQTLFVLPANVYPSTKLVPSEVLGGTFSERLKIVVGEAFPKRKPPAAAPKTAGGKSAAAKSAADTVEASAVPTKTVARPRVKLSLPKIDVKKAAKRTLTPLRMLMLAVVAILSLTGYWVSQKGAAEAAQQVWLKSGDDIKEHLDNREFVNLEDSLKQAVDAGKVLGKSDPDWRSTLNLYQQTYAANNMASGDLLNAFHQAYNKNGRLEDHASVGILAATQPGSYVFDSHLKPDAANPGFFLFELPVSPGRHTVKASIGLPQLADFMNTFDDGRILFSAAIASVKSPADESQNSGDSNAWRIELEPTTFVLLTNEALADSIGLAAEFDPEIATVLSRQEDFVRTSETWEFREGKALTATTTQSPAKRSVEQQR